ncbi:hypothetical protein [Herbaspirillum sp. RV1423]|uniref:hypothetical protein n=1 Tax=Herbaspirillum sp. RV1423 TaxID=1443993 RepID=UPI00054FC347|nr:hypothetical protein [Herbaspirillum sp. RV1423]
MLDEKQPRKDEEVDRIRSIFWFYLIAASIGSSKATDVRKALEPHKSSVNKHGQSDKNEKFAHYRSGERMPNSTLVDLANRKVPGSRACIDHPLWRVLRFRGSIQLQASSWIGRLSSRVQNLMFTNQRTLIEPASQLQLENLVRDKSLDSLAALTVIYRLSQEREDADAMWTCATAIFQLLVMMNGMLSTFHIGQLLYDLYADRLLRSASCGGNIRAWDVFQYDVGAEVIHLYAHLSQKKINGRRRHPDYYVMQAMTESHPRQVDEFLPILLPNLGLGPPTSEGAELLRKYLALQPHLASKVSQADSAVD